MKVFWTTIQSIRPSPWKKAALGSTYTQPLHRPHPRTILGGVCRLGHCYHLCGGRLVMTDLVQEIY